MDNINNNATFWLSLAGILSALIGGILASINKSKCVKINCCWGVIDCTRDVQAEVEIEEHRIDMGVPESPRNNNSI